MNLLEAPRQVAIIGSGPAGLTAAIYAARAALDPLVLAGAYWGGQLVLTSEVENFPGYPNGVQGPEMMDELRAQAERFGAEVRMEDVTRVDFSRRPFVIETHSEVITAHSVIIATGAAAKRLDVPGETTSSVEVSRPAPPAMGGSIAKRTSPSSAAAILRWRRHCF